MKSQKNKIIATLTVCSILFSGMACFLIYHYLAPSRSTIYLFNDSYAAGMQLTAGMLTPVQVDAAITMGGKRSTIEEAFVTPAQYQGVIASGDSLRMDVTEGMPLTMAMLSVAGGTSVEMNMQSDAIAVTIPLDSYTGITNALKEGARVNIYCSMNNTTYLLQQNKRILEVYKNDGSICGVSVETNMDESLELIYAATYGNLYLGLVDATGYQAYEGKMLQYPITEDSELTLNIPDSSAGYVNADDTEDGWQEYLDNISGESAEETETETEAISETIDDVSVIQGGDQQVFLPDLSADE